MKYTILFCSFLAAIYSNDTPHAPDKNEAETTTVSHIDTVGVDEVQHDVDTFSDGIIINSFSP
jgi:hypothetical protein